MQNLLLVAGSYLFGAISPAHIICRALSGIDLRTVDSGNLGARNAGRALGTRVGIAVLILDIAKGLLPVLVARAAGAPFSLQIACGAATVVGHNWSIYYGLRGGRGAATMAGAVAAFLPLAVGAGLVVALILMRATGSLYVGGSVAVLLTVALAYGMGRRGADLWGPFVIVVPLVLRHIPDAIAHLREKRTSLP
ncbi:glycerol-3-phosphate acyltransferase [bacterium]|nr:glycerol-3-phosphate acyltransferase [bacterium]